MWRFGASNTYSTVSLDVQIPRGQSMNRQSADDRLISGQMWRAMVIANLSEALFQQPANDLPLSRERRWADASYHLLAFAPLVGCSGVLGAGCPSE